jgi:hypothetical protein
MTDINSTREFSEKLASLSLPTQRRVGSEFASDVLSLASDRRLKQVIDIAGKIDSTVEELQMAYQIAHSVYVETQPESGFHELDFKRQAAHFVAQACLICVAPTYSDAKIIHLAQKVAMYCRMALTCSCMPHEQEKGLDFSNAEREVEKLINNQHAILIKYLDK